MICRWTLQMHIFLFCPGKLYTYRLNPSIAVFSYLTMCLIRQSVDEIPTEAKRNFNVARATRIFVCLPVPFILFREVRILSAHFVNNLWLR
jgi:hypothetical protein